MHHLVSPAKYRRVVFDAEVDVVLKEVRLGIKQRYQVKVVEIGTDKDHVHLLVQSVPTYTVTRIVTLLKSRSARDRARFLNAAGR